MDAPLPSKDADAPPPIDPVTRGMGGKAQFNLNGTNHPFHIRPIFDKKRYEEIKAVPPRAQGPLSESLKRCLDMDPSLAENLQSGQVERMHTDLFFSRPVEGYFSAPQAWSDRRNDTPQSRLYKSIDDFLIHSFYNPRIGSHGSIVCNYAGEFSFTSKDNNDTDRAVTLPKQRVDVEVILRDPYIEDVKQRFARSNIIGLRDRRSFIDEFSMPGLYILAQIWDNQYRHDLITLDELIEREYLLYELTRLDVHRVIKKVSAKPEMAQHRTSLVELVKKAKSELVDILKEHRRQVKVQKAQVRVDYKDDVAAIARMINAIEKEAAEYEAEIGPGDHIEPEKVVKNAIRANIVYRHPEKSQKQKPTASKNPLLAITGKEQKLSVNPQAPTMTHIISLECSDPESYSLDAVVNLVEYVKRVVKLLDPETAERLLIDYEAKGIGSDLYNIDDADSPINPARTLSFENSKRVFRDICPGLVETSPQFNYSNYVNPDSGVRMYPFPDLVFSFPISEFSPQHLQKQLLPFHHYCGSQIEELLVGVTRENLEMEKEARSFALVRGTTEKHDITHAMKPFSEQILTGENFAMQDPISAVMDSVSAPSNLPSMKPRGAIEKPRAALERGERDVSLPTIAVRRSKRERR